MTPARSSGPFTRPGASGMLVDVVVGVPDGAAGTDPAGAFGCEGETPSNGPCAVVGGRSPAGRDDGASGWGPGDGSGAQAAPANNEGGTDSQG